MNNNSIPNFPENTTEKTPPWILPLIDLVDFGSDVLEGKKGKWEKYEISADIGERLAADIQRVTEIVRVHFLMHLNNQSHDQIFLEF